MGGIDSIGPNSFTAGPHSLGSISGSRGSLVDHQVSSLAKEVLFGLGSEFASREPSCSTEKRILPFNGGLQGARVSLLFQALSSPSMSHIKECMDHLQNRSTSLQGSLYKTLFSLSLEQLSHLDDEMKKINYDLLSRLSSCEIDPNKTLGSFKNLDSILGNSLKDLYSKVLLDMTQSIENQEVRDVLLRFIQDK